MLDLKRGSTLGGYEIIRELGRGGMGVVYKAHEQSLQRVVALKVLPAHLVEDPQFVERFKREARSAAQLNHPNIVYIYAVGEQDGTHFIAMEYVKGTALIDLIRQKGQLDLQQSLKISGQIAQALDAAHAVGIVHRDIKPHNIMIDDAQRARVMDFGLAYLSNAQSKLTSEGTSLGTPAYMSPEQCQGRTLTAASDIYSLGVTLYQMLAGQTPFNADSPLAIMHQIVTQTPKPVTEYNSDVPPPVVAVLDKMMARDPKKRYQNAQDLSDDLRRVFQGKTPTASPSQGVPSVGSPASIGFTPDKTKVSASSAFVPSYSSSSPSTGFIPDDSKVSKSSAFVPTPLARARINFPLKPIGIGVGVVVLIALLAVGLQTIFARLAASRIDGPLPERTLHFPDDRNYGGLGLRDWDDTSGRTFYDRPLGAARGDVTVPAGQDLGVQLDQGQAGALAVYADLPANAFQSMRINADYDFSRDELAFISHFVGLESLRILDAKQMNLDLSLLSEMTRLRNLEIRSSKLTIDDMRALSDLNELERLTLWGSSVPSFGLQYLSDKTALKYLDLTFNPIDDAGIAYLRNLHELETLLFAHDHMSDKGWETLLQFPKLKWLTMDVYREFDGGWTDETMKVVAQLQHLERLGIQNHKLTAEGLRLLKDTRSLRDLSIWSSVIDFAMAQVLSELTQVETLNLAYSVPSITSEQLAWLQKCRHLKQLNLSQHRDAGDEIVPALSRFTFLRTLYLHDTSISQQGLNTLRAALPNTDVRK